VTNAAAGSRDGRDHESIWVCNDAHGLARANETALDASIAAMVPVGSR